MGIIGCSYSAIIVHKNSVQYKNCNKAAFFIPQVVVDGCSWLTDMFLDMPSSIHDAGYFQRVPLYTWLLDDILNKQGPI